MTLPQMSLAVVGAHHPNRRGPTRLFELAMCTPGEPVELRPEPDNPADPYAVAVYSCRGIQIGYLRADRAPRMGSMIRAGRELTGIFQDQAGWGGVIRVAFDGVQPELPEAIEPDRSEEPDFWPDYIPPDD